MALDIRSVTPAKSRLLMVTFVAVLALVAQPMYGAVSARIASALAASVNVAVTPTEHTLPNGGEAFSTFSAVDYEGLSVSFNFDILPLDKTDDKLEYGYKIGETAAIKVGEINGATNNVPDVEVGERNFNLPVEANNQNLSLYFKNHGNMADDVAKVTGISVQGRAIAAQQPSPSVSVGGFNVRDAENYAGVAVDFRVANFTDATKATVVIERNSGGDVTKEVKNLSGLINDGVNRSVTAPFAIQERTYKDDASSSWHPMSPNVWTKDTVPTNAYVVIETPAGRITSNKVALNTASNRPTYESVLPPAPEPAPTTRVVREDSLDGWRTTIARSDAEVNFVSDASKGALQLKTADNGDSKATYSKDVGVKLSDLRTMSYEAKQNSASFAAGMPSYQLSVCLYGVVGGCNGFTTLVYEPYVSEGNSAVQSGQWQTWQVSAGKFYSTKTVGSLTGSAGAYEHTYTLDRLKSEFPAAVVYQLSLNVGGGNPAYDTLVDNVRFDNVVYDFDYVLPDTAAPVIHSFSPSDDGVVAGVQEFVVNATDDSGIEKIALYVWNESGVKAKEVALKQDVNDVNRWAGSIDTKTLADGKYQLGLRAVALGGENKVKLYNNRKNSHEITIDNTSPVVRNVKLSDVTINGDEVKKGSLPVLTADIDGTGSNVATVEYRIHTAAGDKVEGFGWISVDAKYGGFDQTSESIEEVLTMDGLSDGDYLVRVRAFDAAGNKKSGNDVTFRLDTVRADVKTTTPVNGSRIKGTERFNVAATDLHGVNKIAMYVNKDGTKVREFALKQNGDTWYYDVDTARLAGDGEYKISFRAVDNSGNVTYVNNRLNSYSVFVDNTVPEVKIHAPVLSHGSDPIIKGVAEDVSGIKSHWFEITHPTDGLFYVFGKSEFNLSEAKDNKSPKNAINIVDGKYKIRYVATDNVGNRSDAPNYTNPTIHYMTIDRSPVLSGVYFVPQEDHLSVGFSVNRFKDASSVKVELLDENGDVVVTNIGDSESMKTLLNGRNGEISSPFYFTNELPTDEYWTFGKVDWTKVATPVSARVTVAYGGSSVKTAPIDATESELGYTYEALVAQYAKSISTGSKKPAQSQTTKTPESVSGTAADEEGLLTIPNDLQSPFTQVTSPVFRAFGSFASNNPTPVADIDEESSEVLGSRAEAQSRSSGEVLGTSDQADEANQAGWGMAWYWWLVILAGLGLIGWMIAAAVRRRREDAQLGF